MTPLTCVRCGRADAPRQSFQPFQTPLGARAFQEVCADCWAEWMKAQQQLINHYGLQLRDPKAKEFLWRNMEQYLFAGGEIELG